MKKCILLFVFAMPVALFFGCKKDNNSGGPVNLSPSCKIIEGTDNKGSRYTYEYNLSGKVTKITGYDSTGSIVSNHTLNYFSDRIISTMNFEGDSFETSFFLNSTGNVMKRLENFSTSNDTTEYEYDSEGCLYKEKSRYSITTYEYSNGNRIKGTTVSSGTSAPTYEYYEYYTGKLNNHEEFIQIIPMGKKDKNLIKKSSNPYFISEYVYVENEKGQIASTTITHTEPGKAPQTFVSNYTYKCN